MHAVDETQDTDFSALNAGPALGVCSSTQCDRTDRAASGVPPVPLPTTTHPIARVHEMACSAASVASLPGGDGSGLQRRPFQAAVTVSSRPTATHDLAVVQERPVRDPSIVKPASARNHSRPFHRSDSAPEPSDSSMSLPPTARHSFGDMHEMAIRALLSWPSETSLSAWSSDHLRPSQRSANASRGLSLAERLNQPTAMHARAPVQETALSTVSYAPRTGAAN
jgi:hypothetical protein